MRRVWCLILIMLGLTGGSWIPARAQTPPPEVKITAVPDAGYLVTTPVYLARIGADGNLHSLTLNGVEFLDDKIAGSAGASFFVERPIALPNVTADKYTITATNGVYLARYDFDEGFFSLTLRHASPKGAAFTVVFAEKIAYAENTGSAGIAATPASYDWPDVTVIMPTGEYLQLENGTRIYGQALGRQVWECSNIAPNKEYTVIFTPGRGEPRTPSLPQLTTLSAAFANFEQLLPGGAPVEVNVVFQNNSNQAINTELALRAQSTDGVTVRDERKPLACAAHQTTTVTWSVTPPAADFYTLTATTLLNGTAKTYVTTFGYDVTKIAPVTKKPADFDEYWARVQAEAKAGAVKLTRLEDRTRSTGTVTVYRIGLEAEGYSCFGWLAVPKFPGKYPGLLLLPGERVRNLTPNAALADCGFVVMTVEPTGQAVDDPVKPLMSKAFTSLHDPAAVGLRGIALRYLQALDALAGVPEVDGNRLSVTGVSLGGALAMILAALDERVQAVAPDVPYLCDIESGRDAVSWSYSEVREYLKSHPAQQDAVWNTLRYFDAANFTDALTCPALISAGINDTYSRPARIYALYNRLPGPKVLRLYLAGHDGGGSLHWAEKVKWLGQVLGGPAPAPKADQP